MRLDFSAHHLAEVRLSIEPTIIRLIANHITGEELENIENNIAFCEEKLEKSKGAIQLKDYHAIGAKNLEFHRLIAQATYNPIFVLTIDYLMEFIFDFRKSLYTPDINLCAKVVSDHKAIFRSLKAGKGEEAEIKMLNHLKYLEEYQMNEGL